MLPELPVLVRAPHRPLEVNANPIGQLRVVVVVPLLALVDEGDVPTDEIACPLPILPTLLPAAAAPAALAAVAEFPEARARA